MGKPGPPFFFSALGTAPHMPGNVADVCPMVRIRGNRTRRTPSSQDGADGADGADDADGGLKAAARLYLSNRYSEAP